MNDKRCAWCGKVFTITDKEKVYCLKTCRDKAKENSKKFYKLNQEKMILKTKEWGIKNRAQMLKNKCDYYKKRRTDLLQYQKEYRSKKENKIKINIRNNKYKKNKRINNIHFRMYESLSSRIRSGLKQQLVKKDYKQKESYTKKVLGCSFENLKEYLENQFKDGMSWDNYGKNGWEIDHIKPCCSFNLSKPEEQIKCFNYKNLQPLWAKDNMKKGGN